MLTAHSTGDPWGSVREQFLAIMCSDPTLLGHAFEAIINEEYGNHDAHDTKGGASQTARQRSEG